MAGYQAAATSRVLYAAWFMLECEITKLGSVGFERPSSGNRID